MKKKTLIVIVVALTLAVLWVLSPIGTGQNYLNENQKASLCDALAGEVDPADVKFYKSIDAEAATAAAIDILGVQKSSDEFYVYGYEFDGEFVSFKDAAYETSGGCGEFMVKIRCDGDAVELVEVFGDGVTTQATWDAMPLRFRLKAQLFSGEFGYDMLERELHTKIENRLGVPVDPDYYFSVEGDMIEVSTWAEDHIEYKYREKIHD